MRPIRLLLAALALATAVAGAVAPAQSRAQIPKVKLLVTEPYYMGFHQAGEPARGTVLLLHGGGWTGGLGAAADELMGPYIRVLRGWGFDVANVGYRSGKRALRDTADAFAKLRRAQGPDEEICIYGTSAGAQLGLMIAAERDDVACVIDLLGPPDLADFGARPWSARGEALARQAFGSRVGELSPIENAGRIGAPVLIGAADCDRYIEPGAQEALADAINESGGRAQLVPIETGRDIDLEHCKVSRPSFRAFEKQARQLLERVTPEPDPPPAPPDPEAGGGGISLGLIALAAAIVAAGLALLVRALRR